MISADNLNQPEIAATVPYRPLGLIKELLESMNLELTYMYEDLIFVEHNAFLLQMGEKGEDLFVWFNSESTAEDRPEILERMERMATQQSLKIITRGIYTMHQNDLNESFQLEFISQSL